MIVQFPVNIAMIGKIVRNAGNCRLRHRQCLVGWSIHEVP